MRAQVHIQRPRTLMVVREWVGCGAGLVGRFDVFPQGSVPYWAWRLTGCGHELEGQIPSRPGGVGRSCMPLIEAYYHTGSRSLGPITKNV